MVQPEARGSSLVLAPCSMCGLHHAPGMACPVAAALPVRADAQTLAPGTILAGRFRITALMHRSGMSAIYRAGGDRSSPLAVKLFSSRGQSPEEQAESLRWLAREAGLLSSLWHPGLPTLVAAFSEGDDHYVVMPFVPGMTVKERVEQKGPLPELDALKLARELTDVLAYLHSQEPPIIHRDLKPANILIRPDGHVTLLDLGVARALAPGTVGTAIGTPGYAPPEQYQGLADERSDLYGLGATMHYMLTGYDAEHEAPFRHPTIRRLNSALHPEIDRLVAVLLRLAPGERPSDARTVGRDLAAVEGAVRARLARVGTVVALDTMTGLYVKALRAFVRWTLLAAGISATCALIVSIDPLGIPGNVLGVVSPWFAFFYVLFSWTFFQALSAKTPWAVHRQVEALAGLDDRMRRMSATIDWSARISLSLGGLGWLGHRFFLGPMLLWIWLVPVIVLLLGWKIAGNAARRQHRGLDEFETDLVARLAP